MKRKAAFTGKDTGGGKGWGMEREKKTKKRRKKEKKPDRAVSGVRVTKGNGKNNKTGKRTSEWAGKGGRESGRGEEEKGR